MPSAHTVAHRPASAGLRHARLLRAPPKADRAAGLDPDLADAADLEALGLGPTPGGDDADAEGEEADEDEETTTSNGGDPREAFDLVIPSLPGFAGRLFASLDDKDAALALAQACQEFSRALLEDRLHPLERTGRERILDYLGLAFRAWRGEPGPARLSHSGLRRRAAPGHRCYARRHGPRGQGLRG